MKLKTSLQEFSSIGKGKDTRKLLKYLLKRIKDKNTYSLTLKKYEH